MSVRDVKNTIRTLTQDGMLDANDVKQAFESAGGKVSADEMNAIKDAVLSADNVNINHDSFSNGYNTTLEAFNEAQSMGARMPILGNQLVKTETLDEATAIRGTSFAGSEIPQAVQDVLAKAYENGLEPFDVNDTKRNNETGEVKGVYTNYPSVSAPVGNMAFSHTEITPKALQDDIDAVDLEYNVMRPTSTLGPGGQRISGIDYETRTGGTGNISAHYDESGMHTDLFARGSSGQKWANNFAILSDGSIHALPAARRDGQSNVILTNPALARGKRVLYMGHLDVRGGVVQNVEMSGRLCKMAANGDQKFIDPIAILQGWGFEMSDRLTRSAENGGGVQYSNTSDGTPVRNIETGVIESPN